MGTRHSGIWLANSEPSWTDETLPLEVRRTLLDKALDRIKAEKGVHPGRSAGQDRPEQPGHPGESGSESPGPRG